MDTSPQVDTRASAENQSPSSLRRRYRSVEEKRRIVEQTLGRGASVARIAREHGVNANQVFGWRLLYKKGRLGGAGRKLLPSAAGDTARAQPSEKLRWSLETKQRIVAASLVPGVCVKDLAQAHGVHHSLVYDWRKKYGRKKRTQKSRPLGLLPVTVSEASVTKSGESAIAGTIEIELAKGRVRIVRADASWLRTAMELLR